MTCITHPDREQISACNICGQALCQECLFYANSEPYCHSCVSILEREREDLHKKRVRRTILSVPLGAIIAVGAVFGWRWILLQTKFGMVLFTPIITIGIILGVALILARVAGDRNVILFGTGVVLGIGILLGGEYITYDYKLYKAAQEGLSAEKLLRFSKDNSYENHLRNLGIFDYLFFLFGIFMIWRRLWPVKSDDLVILRPVDLEHNG